MNKEHLYINLSSVERIASASKIGRMLENPFNYVHAILFRTLFYPKSKSEKEVICDTFFGVKMNILLPSSTDIYLTGGKSHHSEIKLAKFLINTLQPGDDFLDIGAHYGYFALLASKLIGDQGKVLAIEASPVTFKVLSKNRERTNNIEILNVAVSDKNVELIFYEFPNLYSEYNTLDITQFENEKWFHNYRPKEVKVQAKRLDDLLTEKDILPKIIKIDVEGAEFKVINGAKNYLDKNSPIIVLEYLSSDRGNKAHLKAEELLKKMLYDPFVIDNFGETKSIENIPNYLKKNKMESDNIVFIKN